MGRKEYFEQVRDNFFEDRTVDFEGLKTMISGVGPVFGELETEITETLETDTEKYSKTIKFIDRDEADMVFAPEGYKPSKEDLDMSTVICRIHMDKDNVINIVEHNFGMFTPANKESVLFFSHLIGKKVQF